MELAISVVGDKTANADNLNSQQFQPPFQCLTLTTNKFVLKWDIYKLRQTWTLFCLDLRTKRFGIWMSPRFYSFFSLSWIFDDILKKWWVWWVQKLIASSGKHRFFTFYHFVKGKLLRNTTKRRLPEEVMSFWRNFDIFGNSTFLQEFVDTHVVEFEICRNFCRTIFLEFYFVYEINSK